jgi:hypothetical protein
LSFILSFFKAQKFFNNFTQNQAHKKLLNFPALHYRYSIFFSLHRSRFQIRISIYGITVLSLRGDIACGRMHSAYLLTVFSIIIPIVIHSRCVISTLIVSPAILVTIKLFILIPLSACSHHRNHTMNATKRYRAATEGSLLNWNRR